MKKSVITALLLLSTGLVQAMDSNKKEKNVIKGNITIFPETIPVGTGTIDLIDAVTGFVAEEKANINQLMHKSLQNTDNLQLVFAYKTQDKTQSFSATPILTNNKIFPSHLPVKLLKNLKKNDTLNITIDGNNYEFMVDKIHLSSPNGPQQQTNEKLQAHISRPFFISILPSPPVYIGNGNIDFTGDSQKNVKDIFNDQSLQPQDLLQPVWIWQKENKAENCLKEKILPNTGLDSGYIPLKYLENRKDDDSFNITIDGKKYTFKVNQSEFKDNKLSFAEMLEYNKREFNNDPHYLNNNENFNFLLKNNILHKSLFGQLTHGQNRIAPLTDKDGTKAGVIAQWAHQLKWVLKNGI